MSGIVIFEGAKFFWRTRNSIDVWIVEHKLFDIYELIVYEPSMDTEAPRLYLSSKELLEKVGNEEIETKLSFAKRNNVPLTENFVAGVVNKVLADYILNRILMKEFILEEKQISIELRIDDVHVILRQRPETLEEYKTKHYKKLMEGAVDQALEALKEGKKELHESTDNAAELAGLNIRQRWRMPLVINKVNRGERLNANDEKIFNRVKSNMKTENDLANMKACMGMSNNISQLNTPRRIPRHTPRRSFESATSGHSPRRNSQCPSPMSSRQPSLRRTSTSGGSTLYLPTESSQRRLLEYGSCITPTSQSRRNSTDTTASGNINSTNAGTELKRRKSKAVSPMNAVKSKKLVKKPKTPKSTSKSEGNVGCGPRIPSADTDLDGEAALGFEDEEEGKEKQATISSRASFGIAGSFKSVLGSVKNAIFGTTAAGITTVSEEEEYVGNHEPAIVRGASADTEAGDGTNGDAQVCTDSSAAAGAGMSGVHTEDCTDEVQEAVAQQLSAYAKLASASPETNEAVQTTDVLKTPTAQPLRRSSQLASFLLGFATASSSPSKALQKSLSKQSLSSEKQEKLNINVPEGSDKPFHAGSPGSPKAKPTRRTSQLGSFLSGLAGGLAATALGGFVRGWGAGGSTTSSKVVPCD